MNTNYKLNNFILITLILTFISGIVFIEAITARIESEQRSSFLKLAGLICNLAINDIKTNIKQWPYAANSLPHKNLCGIFRNIQGSYDDIKYVYLLGISTTGEIFFYADSESFHNTPLELPAALPGESYTTRPEKLYEVFLNKEKLVIGPYTDKWGTFTSAYIPIESLNGEPFCVLALDIVSSTWFLKINQMKLIIWSLILLVVALIVILFNYIKHQKAINNKAVKRIEFQAAVLELIKIDNSEYFPALERILSKITTLLNANKTSLWTYNDSNELKCEIMHSLHGNSFSNDKKILINQCQQYFSALENERALISNDVNNDIRFKELTEKYYNPLKINSAMDILIWLHGKKAGILCIDREDKNTPWTEEEKDFAVSIANMISLIIESQERKMAEENISKLKTAFEQTIEGIVIIDTESNIIFVNNAWLKMHGYSDLNEVTGMPVKIFYDEKYYNEYGDIFRKKTFELGHYESEVVQKKKNGSTFATWFSATILKNANGEYSGMVGIARDITERKKYEEEALKETKLESLGILAGGIAHDFNNVLMGIIGNITLAKKRTVNDEKTYEILKRAEKVAYKAQNLTRQLITFSKGGLLLKSLNSLNEIVSGTAHFTLTGSNITLKLSLAKDLKNAYIDEGQITQVITNIILNAKQAISENPQNSNGTIEIKTENKIFAADNSLGLEPGNYIQLQIKDNGPGISPENLSKIFDPYFTTKPAGSGLGLSTTYSIIKGHNGAITAKSELNKETYFDIYIPAANESNISPPAEISAEHKSDNKRLLIMDDDETVLIPLYEMLTDSGYAVKLARNGDEAVLLYTQSLKEGQKFDAVILDLIIKGGLGGVETIKKILELDREAAAIVSSGYSDDPVMAEYKKYGFKGFLAKPYHSHEIEELLARIIKKEQ